MSLTADEPPTAADNPLSGQLLLLYRGFNIITMKKENTIRFVDEAHKAFYEQQSLNLKPDIYLRSLLYTLGMCGDTRRHFDSIYDAGLRGIDPQAIREPWQTGASLKVTRLAFQLFTDSTPTAYLDDAASFDECKKYSVSDIFCCSYASFFIEAINLRYPEYLVNSGGG